MSQFNNRSMLCKKHKQIITNYCMICFQPLCPQDMQEHFEFHKYTKDIKIETIKKTRQVCFGKIDKIRQFIQKQNQKSDLQGEKTNIQGLISQILKIKSRMITEIQKYVDTKIKDLQILQQECRKLQIKKPINQAAKVINTYLDQLQFSHPEFLETIKQVILLDDHEFIKVFFNQINEHLNKYKSTKVQIKYNQIQYRELIKKCLQIINPYQIPLKYNIHQSIFNPKPQPQQNSQSLDLDSINPPHPYGKFLKGFNPKHKQKSSQLNKSDIKDNPSQSNINNNSKRIILKNQDVALLEPPKIVQNIIKIQGKQIQQKFIHFLQPQSTKLHIIRIPSFKKQIININLPFPIPTYHKSLQISSSSIIITGGKLQNNKKNNKVFLYNVQKNKLKQICEVVPRSSHAICQQKGNLYILGGIGENNIQKTVQKINLQKFTLQYKRNSRFGGSCIAVSDGKTIFKFSTQGIQLFDQNLDAWKYILLKNYNFNLDANCVLANKNEIMVFGGYDQSERGVRNSYSLMLSAQITLFDHYTPKTMVIAKINKFPLTKGQGFADNSCILIRDKIYALQNIVDQFNDCLSDQRSLIIFNGKFWQTKIV